MVLLQVFTNQIYERALIRDDWYACFRAFQVVNRLCGLDRCAIILYYSRLVVSSPAPCFVDVARSTLITSEAMKIDGIMKARVGRVASVKSDPKIEWKFLILVLRVGGDERRHGRGDGR